MAFFRYCDEDLSGCGCKFNPISRFQNLCPKCIKRVRYENLKKMIAFRTASSKKLRYKGG